MGTWLLPPHNRHRLILLICTWLLLGHRNIWGWTTTLHQPSLERSRCSRSPRSWWWSPQQTFQWSKLTMASSSGVVEVPDTNGTATNNIMINDDNDDVVRADEAMDRRPFGGGSLSAWQILAGNIATCLVAADMKRDSDFEGASTGWASWVEDSSAFRLQQCLDKLVFQDTHHHRHHQQQQLWNNNLDQVEIGRNGAVSAPTSRQDESIRWLRWMKNTPAPLVLDYSQPLREAVDALLTTDDYQRLEQNRTAFLSRIVCRIIALPSGTQLRDNLRSPPGAMVYGKLLFGGVTRFRILGSTDSAVRKAGERTVLASAVDSRPTEAWLQYGGPERCYEAVDVGPGALMEVILTPKNLMYRWGDGETIATQEMIATASSCMMDPNVMFRFPSTIQKETNVTDEAIPTTLEKDDEQHEGKDDGFHRYTHRDLERGFSTVLGGLQPEIQAIIRRVLDGRVHSDAASRSKELQALLDLGLSPVRGLLLYGVPGCGKTALAREISRLLTDRPPKIVSAPELLDRWVGGSERLVRDLFSDAEAELRAFNGDVSRSGLHVIVIDELDAVFRKRSPSAGSGEVSRASAVNQILAKLDGVNSLGNVLLIGTTNRRELLDDALLRPGRLEVQAHVPLPDQEGRREILQIYFGPLRNRGRLSQPLCLAIDGHGDDDSLDDRLGSAPFLPRFAAKISWDLLPLKSRKIHDLATDRWTGGFSGADLEGLVRCAGSLALARVRTDGSGVDGLIITVEDVMRALDEVKK